MNRLTILFIFFILSAHFELLSQSEDQKTMRSFVPRSQAYDIYYPLDYQIKEGEDGIVTISDSVSEINITISSYILKTKPRDIDIIELLNSFINDNYSKQHKPEDWNSYKCKFDNLVELRTNFDGANWVWYGINNKKSFVVISINKDTEISQEEINLVMFMIDNMVIN